MKVITFGEPLLIHYIGSDSSLYMQGFGESHVSWGGSEINTAVALQTLGNTSYVISVLPDNELGNDYIKTIDQLGINTELVIRSK